VKPLMKYGGIAASVILIVFGLGSIYTGLNGRSEVRDTLKLEQIVGTPDMDKQIANKPVDTGAKAKLFAAGIRKHTLEATHGQVYSEMDRFLTKSGKPTSDEKAAAISKETGKPVENGARNIWVTSTALSTALNTSFFAESVATFATVMGAAMLLIGIGFLVMVFRLPMETVEAAKRRQALAAKVAAGTA
jgi:preprotein translocase subunit Sss1